MEELLQEIRRGLEEYFGKENFDCGGYVLVNGEYVRLTLNEVMQCIETSLEFVDLEDYVGGDNDEDDE